MSEPAPSFVAECFWPGVTEQDVRLLGDRIRAAVAQLDGDGRALRYSGSLFMTTDEVVLCVFEGSEELVRRVAEQAAVPFDRIVQSLADLGPTLP